MQSAVHEPVSERLDGQAARQERLRCSTVHDTFARHHPADQSSCAANYSVSRVRRCNRRPTAEMASNTNEAAPPYSDLSTFQKLIGIPVVKGQTGLYGQVRTMALATQRARIFYVSLETAVPLLQLAVTAAMIGLSVVQGTSALITLSVLAMVLTGCTHYLLSMRSARRYARTYDDLTALLLDIEVVERSFVEGLESDPHTQARRLSDRFNDLTKSFGSYPDMWVKSTQTHSTSRRWDVEDRPVTRGDDEELSTAVAELDRVALRLRQNEPLSSKTPLAIKIAR